MSKISDYLRAIRGHKKKIEEARQRQTVAGFAEELRKPIETLLDQFDSAGIQKKADDFVTDLDKLKLLQHLQSPHGADSEGRKRIVLSKPLSDAERLWQAVAQNDNGAAMEALSYFAELVTFEQPIDPDLQRLTNLILAKSILEGALPASKRGRPKSDDVEQLGKDVAQIYWEMRDGGKSYADTVALISGQVHKDERHIMRMVEANKKWVGETKERREANRKWLRVMRDISKRSEESNFSLVNHYFFSLPSELAQAEFQSEDWIDHLDELIRVEAEAKRH